MLERLNILRITTLLINLWGRGCTYVIRATYPLKQVDFGFIAIEGPGGLTWTRTGLINACICDGVEKMARTLRAVYAF